MNTEEKGKLIWAIIHQLKNHATATNRQFDTGDTFFSLAFKSDTELTTIAKLAGIK